MSWTTWQNESLNVCTRLPCFLHVQNGAWTSLSADPSSPPVTSTHCQVSSSDFPLYSVFVSVFSFYISMVLSCPVDGRFLFVRIAAPCCASRFFKSINFALRVSDSFAFTSAPAQVQNDLSDPNVNMRPQRSTERNFWTKKLSMSFVFWPGLVSVLLYIFTCLY